MLGENFFLWYNFCINKKYFFMDILSRLMGNKSTPEVEKIAQPMRSLPIKNEDEDIVITSIEPAHGNENLAEIILSNGEFKTERNVFKEAVENSSYSMINDDGERKKIISEVNRLLENLRRENSLIVKSKKQKDVWESMIEKINQQADLEDNSKALLGILMEDVLKTATEAEGQKTKNIEVEKIEPNPGVELGQDENIAPVVNVDAMPKTETVDVIVNGDEVESSNEENIEPEKKVNLPNFENCKKLVFGIFDVTENEIEKTQFENNLKEESCYLERFDEIKTEGLSEEQLKELETLVDVAKQQIGKVFKEKKRKLSKDAKEVVIKEQGEQEIQKPQEAQEEQKEQEIEARETQEEQEKNEHAVELQKLKERFEKAIEKVEYVFSFAEFDEKYAELTTGGEMEGDIREKMREYMELSPKFLFEAVDAHSDKEKEEWAEINATVNILLDENNDRELVVVEDADGEKTTYVVIKKIESEKKNANENKKEKEEFDIALELAQNFRSKLVEVLQQDQGWGKRRKKYQDSFLEGEVVAFLDELLEQQKLVEDEQKEIFIKNVLAGLKNVK